MNSPLSETAVRGRADWSRAMQIPLGYFVFPYRRRLRNDNGHRFARRLRRFAQRYRAGRLAWAGFNPSVQSWLGHARHADTLGLRRKIFSETVFVRGMGPRAATA